MRIVKAENSRKEEILLAIILYNGSLIDDILFVGDSNKEHKPDLYFNNRIGYEICKLDTEVNNFIESKLVNKIASSNIDDVLEFMHDQKPSIQNNLEIVKTKKKIKSVYSKNVSRNCILFCNSFSGLFASKLRKLRKGNYNFCNNEINLVCDMTSRRDSPNEVELLISIYCFEAKNINIGFDNLIIITSESIWKANVSKIITKTKETSADYDTIYADTIKSNLSRTKYNINEAIRVYNKNVNYDEFDI